LQLQLDTIRARAAGTHPGLTEIGPKAESLRALATAGLPVPEARFLDCAAYREHATRAGVQALLESATGEGTPLDPVLTREAIVATPLAGNVAAQLRRWYRELGEGYVAVRSSANAEDLPGASFAGQHGTYFVCTADDLLDRVRDCWASLFSERAVRYRERNGISHAVVAMAVIVQRLVPAQAAGVAFTADPLSGADTVLVEACLGIGEALVSGKVTPDRFAFARPQLRLVEAVAGDKRVRVVVDAVVTEEPVPEHLATALAIDVRTARQIAWLALEAEALFGAPVDVEWAIAGDGLWLLQARPITTLPARPAAHDVASETAAAVAAPGLTAATPFEAATIWSNVNTGEILPDVASPITWSIIYGHADDLFGGMFGVFGLDVDVRELVGLVGGRIYFNLSVLRETFAALPLDADRALGGMHDYVEVPPLERKPHRMQAARAVGRMLWTLPPYVIGHTPKRAVRFAKHLRTETDAALRELENTRTPEEAYRLLERLVSKFAEFSDSLAFMGVAMMGFGALTALTYKWLADEHGALANRLVTGRGDVASAEAGYSLWRLSALARKHESVREALQAEGAWTDVRHRLVHLAAEGPPDGLGASRLLEAWDAFMVEHGHHCRGELEFYNARWAERPGYVLGIVRGYLESDAGKDPVAAHATHSALADEAADECRKVLQNPLKRHLFERALRWGRASARSRENIKSEAVRWLASIRRALLVLGERLAEGGSLRGSDDIFFLTYEEIGAIVNGSADAPAERPSELRAVIDTRRAEYDRLSTLSPPPMVVGEWDESAAAWDVSSETTTLRGISVSAGVVRGPARVFRSADTDETVLRGEILVAPFTDPGWTPYFVPAAGIVMDMGGMLSHGSIIAREYGIPAVVNVGPATRIITTGQLIEVDGDTGEVRILEADRLLNLPV
jgi:phosphohistidine swiveling domain-containing protein